MLQYWPYLFYLVKSQTKGVSIKLSIVSEMQATEDCLPTAHGHNTRNDLAAKNFL
jgi:hypothetical protein